MCGVTRSQRQLAKGEAFAALHAGEPFVIPNPWDGGSARVLEALGFKALATTSSGFAFTLGRLDGAVSLDEVVAHVAAMDAVTELPISVDLEHGFGRDTDAVAAAIRAVAGAGAVGASIEDWDPAGFIYERGEAVARIKAAMAAARDVGFRFTVTARSENLIRGRNDLADTIERLQAFRAAGADVLFAPGLRTVADIRAVCDAVAAPVNVLALGPLSLADITGAGAQRVSVGGQLTWVAAAALVRAATAIHDEGDLSALAERIPLHEWFGG